MGIRARFQVRALLAAAAASTALVSSPALAQPAATGFDIPAEDLGAALTDLGRQSNREIHFDANAARGKRSARLSGPMTFEQALDRLLAGSGLRYRTGATGSIVVEPVAAQGQTQASADAAPPEGSGDVIVTANKREERIIDVASAVTAVGGQTLENRNLPRIENFAALVPGFSVQSGGGVAGGVRLVLRGLNSGGSGATVSTLIDEASLTYTTANGLGSLDTADIDAFDVERIEVLRGPQGTLYGSAAEGGLLKYVFNQPKLGKTEARFSSEVNGVDGGGVGYAFHGVLNLPLTDTLAFRASGFYVRDAGYIDNPLSGRKDINEGERYGGRLSLFWKPSETFDVRVSALRQTSQYGATSQVEVNGAPTTAPLSVGAGQFDIANGGRLERNTYTPEPFTRKFELYDVTAQLHLPWIDLTSITAYGTNYAFFRTDYRDLPVTATFTYGAYLAALVYRQPVDPYGLQTDRLEKITQEVRGATKGLKLGTLPLDIQAGFYWTRERSNYDQRFNTAPLSDLSAVLTTPTVLGGVSLPGLYTEYSGFFDATLHLTPRWQIAAGARYTTEDLTTRSVEYRGVLHPIAPAVLYHPPLTQSEDPVTWSFATRYQLTDRLNVYGRIASGFRPGGPNLPLPGVETPPPYLSDRTVNYEAGIKGDLIPRTLAVDVAIFHIDWTDIQIITSVQTSGGTKNITGNAGTAQSQGVEWKFVLTPLPRLTLGWNGAYTDAHLTRDARTLGGVNGDQLPYVPKFTSTLTGDYNFPIAADVRGFVTGLWSYVDDRRGSFTTSPVQVNKPRIPGYHSVDLQGGVEWSHYRIEAYIQNLTNERGITSYTSTSGYLGRGLADIIRPRTFGARVSVRY